MPNNYITDREKEFDKNWPILWYDRSSIAQDLKSFHRDSLNGLKDLILGEIERWVRIHKNHEPFENEVKPTEAWGMKMYNQALDDLAEFIKSIQ